MSSRRMKTSKRSGSGSDKGHFTALPDGLVDLGYLARMSRAALAVYVVLQRRRDPAGVCFPGVGSIGRLAGVSERTAVSGISELVALGLLEVSRRRQLTNTYRVLELPETAPEFVEINIEPGGKRPAKRWATREGIERLAEFRKAGTDGEKCNPLHISQDVQPAAP